MDGPRRRDSRPPLLVLGLVLVGLVLLALLLAPAAQAIPAPSPITWLPTSSTYGVGETAFLAAPPPMTGVGMTQPDAVLPVVYGAGFWDSTSQVYAMGFVNTMPGGGMPYMPETDITFSALSYHTPLKLVFYKDTGLRIDSVAILGDPDSLVSIEPSDPATLTAATEFTVRATVTDPVKSDSGNVGAAFGLVVDCSPARDFQNSLFVTNMHWLDIDPPTFSASGLAGLSANGFPGETATFDGVFSPAFLTAMGITDPTQVQGYVDITRGHGPDERDLHARWARATAACGRMGGTSTGSPTAPGPCTTSSTASWRKPGQGRGDHAEGHHQRRRARRSSGGGSADGQELRGARLPGQQAAAQEDRRDDPVLEGQQGAAAPGRTSRGRCAAWNGAGVGTFSTALGGRRSADGRRGRAASLLPARARRLTASGARKRVCPLGQGEGE